MKAEQTPSPGMVYRFGLEALARAVSHQLNALLVWHIRDREVGTQLSNCVHLRPSYRWRMSVGIESISGSRFESDSNPAETTTWMIHPEESARGNDPVGSTEGVGTGELAVSAPANRDDPSLDMPRGGTLGRVSSQELTTESTNWKDARSARR